MIHGPAFSLYDAMSAIELMNPKMDPGIVVDNPPPSVAQQLEAGPLHIHDTHEMHMCAHGCAHKQA